MYVVTRRDLPPAQQVVQSIHAAVELARHGLISSDSPHPHLVLCSVPDEESLRRLSERLSFKGVPYRSFNEPDRDNELTAIATPPLCGDARKLFSSLPLWDITSPVAA